MPVYNVALYSKENRNQWDKFIENSPNATFLLKRDFMEYHAHRFEDFSLMIFQSEMLKAIIPANKMGDTLYSHQGLTYGGFFFDKDLSDLEIEEIISKVFEYLVEAGIKVVQIKTLPEFYEQNFNNPYLLAIRQFKLELFRSDKVLAIDYSLPLNIHKTKLKNFRKNQDKGFLIREDDSFDLFWREVLIPRLKEKHSTNPVHSETEIAHLKSRFKNEIKQFNIYFRDELMAGVTIFDKGNIVKSQYGATTTNGQKVRALEYLFMHLIYKYEKEGKSFFSMGTVRDLSKPLGYNTGLLKQKEELGCNIYKQNFYRINLQ